MFNSLKPFGNRILISIVPKESKTSSGIYLSPDNEKSNIAQIIAIGEGKISSQGDLIPMSLKVGDKVIYNKYAGTHLDDEHLIITEDDILGILEK